jgi:hypothetical protein
MNWAMAKRWAMNWIIWLDEGVNVLLGGAENETVSARAGRAKAAGKRWGCVLCGLLDRIQKGHCENAMQARIGDDEVVDL